MECLVKTDLIQLDDAVRLKEKITDFMAGAKHQRTTQELVESDVKEARMILGAWWCTFLAKLNFTAPLVYFTSIGCIN